MNNMYIKELKPNQIFCFGSNLEGAHAGGAAKQAHEHFGAIWGQGYGPQGESYAIPTIDYDMKILPLKDIRLYLKLFSHFAKRMTHQEFLLTPIGTGIAGYSIEEIKSIMPIMPPNVIRVGDW